MKVGFIARGLTRGGVTRYINNLLSEFDKTSVKDIQFLLFTDEKKYLNKYKNINVIYIKSTIKLLWDYFKVIPYIKKEKVDVVLYPKNIIPLTHTLLKFKKINIIHDLAHFKKGLNAYRFFDNLYQKFFMNLSCKIANKTIAVSNSTKKDIVTILGIPKNHITIVYEGVEDSFNKEVDVKKIKIILKNYGIQTPYLFYCGSLSPRKNIIRILEAFNRIKKNIPHNLYLAGGGSWVNKKVVDYIKSNLSGRAKILGYLSEEELPIIYSAAELYFYTSLYEGFGLPILEAQACGCPVLTSNVTSCPEIAGEGAHLVDPYHVDEIAQGMMKILTDVAYKNELIQKGKKNVLKFSWEKTAMEILTICKKNNKILKI